MSRVFEALQKSQGENPSASPLAQGQPESAPVEAPVSAAARSFQQRLLRMLPIPYRRFPSSTPAAFQPSSRLTAGG